MSDGITATPASVSWTVTSVNHVPVVAGTVIGTAIEDGVPSTLNALANATDADSGTTLLVTDVPGTLPAGVSYDAALQTFTLDPSNLAFQHLAAGASTVVSVNYTVSDGIAATPASMSWTVTGSNDAPVVTSATQAGAVQEDVQPLATGQVTASDVDLGATLAYSGDATGVYGSFAIDATSGQWSYALDSAAHQNLAAGETHAETFTVTVTDEHGATAAQDVTITVTGSNDAPVVTSATQAGAVQEDVQPLATGQVTASDVDLGATLAYSGDATGVYGSFAIDATSGQWSYALDSAAHQNLAAGETHAETFTVTVTDEHGATAAQDVTITVTGSNDAPVVSGPVTGTAAEEGAPSTLDALAHASDIDDGTILSVTGLPDTLPAGVTFDAATHSFTLDPGNAAYLNLANGATIGVSVSYAVSDGITATPASVSWTVTSVNHVPVVAGTVIGTAIEDGVPSTLNALANATDADSGTTLLVTDVPGTLPAGVSYDAALQTFTLDPSNLAFQHLAAGASTVVSVNYTVSDGIAATPASMSWTVTGSNDAPVVSGPVTSTAAEEGAPSTLDALAHASDIDDGTILSVTGLPDTLPAGVTFDAATHSFTLDPGNAAYLNLANGATIGVSVSYAVSDGITATPASVSWTVTSVNHVPVVAGTVIGAAIEDGVPSTLNALANATDADSGTTLLVTDVPGTLPAGVSYNAALQTFTLDPSNLAFQHLAAGASTVVSVNYTVSDGIAATPASMSWTVTGSNDAATINGTAAGAVATGGASSATGTLNIIDPDSGEAVFQTPAAIAMVGSYGNFAFDPISGAWSYTLDAAKANSLTSGQVVHDTLSVSSLDSTASQLIDVSVSGRNAPPAPSTPDLLATSDSGVSSTDNITNITTPTFTGTAEVGSTVTLYDGTTAVGTGIANAGNWTITASALSNGTHSITAKATDVAGNLGTASGALSIAIDSAAPAAPSMPDLLVTSDSGVSSTDNITNITTPTFTGTAEVGSTVTLYDGTTAVGTGIANAGNWTITASALSNGTHSITAKATDVAGNLGTASGALSVNIDSTAPAAPSMPDLLATSDSGVSSTDNITNITTPTFAGTAEVGSTVTLYDGATAVGTGVTAATGKWTITTSTLAAGVHAISATAGDVAGNIGAASAALGITIQTTVTAPSAPDLVAASDSGASNTDNITKTVRPDFTGVATPGNTVTLYDGTTVIGTASANATTGKWTINSTKLADGVHSITATAADKFGNLSAASPAMSVTIDTVAPAAPSAPDLTAVSDTGVSNTDNITNLKTPTFTGTAEAGTTVAIYNGTTKVGTGIADANGIWTVTTSSMGNGVHVMTTKATDVAGNVSVASAALSITIDAAAPARPALPDLVATSDSGASSTDNITKVTTPSFAGTAEALGTVIVYDGTAVLGTTTATALGTWSFTAPTLADGTHSITVKATDAAGNASAASSALAVTIDTTTPGAPAFTGGNTTTLRGTGEAGATVTILNGATTVGTATVGSGGNWSWSFIGGPTPLKFAALQTDKAGNIGSTTVGSAQIGTSGNDTLISTAGNDVLIGAGGPDTFSFGAAFGRDIITDFVATGAAHDIVNFHGSAVLNSFANVLADATQTATGVVISDGVNTLTLNNITKNAVTAADFTFV